MQGQGQKMLLVDSCHTYQWVISHKWMSHVTYMNETCHTCEWDMSHISMSHVTHMSQTHCNTLQHTATYCNTLHCNTGAWDASVTSECYKHLPTSTRLSFQDQRGASHCNTLQHALQHTLQLTATHCDTLPHTMQHHKRVQTWTWPEQQDERDDRDEREYGSALIVCDCQSLCVSLHVIVCDCQSLCVESLCVITRLCNKQTTTHCNDLQYSHCVRLHV